MKTKALLIILGFVLALQVTFAKYQDDSTKTFLVTDTNAVKTKKKSKDFRLELSGQIQADAIFDQNKLDSKVFFRPSSIAIPGQTYQRTLFSVANSRVRLKANYQNPNTNFPEISGTFEIDFRNENHAPRIRIAFFEVGKLGFGQNWTNFSDRDVFPNIITNTSGPNALLNIRQPQVRFTYQKNPLTFVLSIEENKPNVTLPNDWDERQVFPDIVASLKYNYPNGHFRLGWLFTPSSYNLPNSNSLKTKLGYAGNLSTKIGIGKRHAIMLQATYGRGYSSYVSDLSNAGFEAYVQDGKFKTARLFSGYVFYDFNINKKWGTSMGWGYNYLEKISLPTSAPFKASNFGVIDLHYTPVKQFKLAFEVLYGDRSNYATPEITADTADNWRAQITTLLFF